MRHERIGGTMAETALARALVMSAREGGVAATVVAHRSRPWASATFVGARHELTLEIDRSRAWGAWTAALPDATLNPRGHLVADLSIERIDDTGASARVSLAALTIEER